MKPSEYLKRGWCQHASAHNGAGNWVCARDPEAAKWCYTGAIEAAFGRGPLYEKFIDRTLARFDWHRLESLIVWNDSPDRSQYEVVALAERVENEMWL